ncbi:TetR/AcrR family transcriptional regulator [Propionibacterium freudenreichii]|uniref:TetR/AcrR family transcriptional regulator n=1 Tax=Propionibacterium freudenreichii TaxID=1744 RepID=UPI0024341601|nr:TetR/AcrR family transcriptional regulator [Propionibacterium freudenreichii]MDK9349425.1 TetR/AcrR family transcriptional regulator [Propionibacterium freudenreichii]MDK9653631.1 TetR/AcrR family transcriptional regulator [Propionibacterium freudenreichii]WFF32871.1 TetR/AcrR family transcriptional regulator [Propionibacterium freudenreichii]
MPKVSAEHRKRQADRILAAAVHCFAENGFHGTSMDQIIAGAGMSSSTVYRYYPGGKTQLIRAVSAVRIGPLVRRIEELTAAPQPSLPSEAFEKSLAILWPGLPASGKQLPAELPQSTRIALNSWSEATRDSEISRVIRGNYLAVRAALVALVERLQREGVITSPLDAEGVSELILTTSLGLIGEQALSGTADVHAAALRLDALLT